MTYAHPSESCNNCNEHPAIAHKSVSRFRQVLWVLLFIVVACFITTLAHGAEVCHFKDSELACKCCGKVHISPELRTRLESLRSMAGKPVIITSCYRCQKHNDDVGGVRDSQHICGRAADIKVKGLSPQEVARLARRSGFTFIKTYSTWTHVDIREQRHYAQAGR